MSVQTATASRATETALVGVSGEFHSFGAILAAARSAQAAGFAPDRMWFVAESSTDRLGEPLGFTMAASYPFELHRLGTTLGVLTGLVFSLALPHPGTLPLALALNVAGGLVGGWLLGAVGGYLTASARLGNYLHQARTSSLRLLIEAADEAETDRAATALRAARAESIWLRDGARHYHSPQTPDWLT